jgi:hypothetical protein
LNLNMRVDPGASSFILSEASYHTLTTYAGAVVGIIAKESNL